MVKGVTKNVDEVLQNESGGKKRNKKSGAETQR
jgi:hypothetical protein